MSPKAQRLAIAKHVGWKQKEDCWVAPNGDVWPVMQGCPAYEYGTNILPDYTWDLNAMHEAESTMECPEQYETELIRVCKETPSWHATAPQRAEAFLRALNLWKNDGP